MEKYCGDKIRYSKSRANEVRRHVQKIRNRKLRMYLCDICYDFHLTSNTRDI